MKYITENSDNYYIRGKVRMSKHIEVGIQCFPHAPTKIFTVGINGQIGKMLVKVR